MTNKNQLQTTKILSQIDYFKLKEDIENILLKTKSELKNYANSLLISTYWRIGQRIEQEKLTQNSNYYSSILNDLEIDLKINKNTLSRIIKFFRTYPDEKYLKNLSWSHYKNLITINDEEKRKELEEKCQEEDWSIQKLVSEIKNLNNTKNSSNIETTIIRPTDANYLYKAKIKEIVDGDTLILLIDLGFQVIKEQRVRLNQIDAKPFNRSKESGKSYFIEENLQQQIQQNKIISQTDLINLESSTSQINSINPNNLTSPNNHLEKNAQINPIITLVSSEEKVKKNLKNNEIDADFKGAKAYDYIRNLSAKLDFVIVKTNKIDIYGRYLADIFYKVNENQRTQTEIFEKGIYLNQELLEKNLVTKF